MSQVCSFASYIFDFWRVKRKLTNVVTFTKIHTKLPKLSKREVKADTTQNAQVFISFQSHSVSMETKRSDKYNDKYIYHEFL